MPHPTPTWSGSPTQGWTICSPSPTSGAGCRWTPWSGCGGGGSRPTRCPSASTRRRRGSTTGGNGSTPGWTRRGRTADRGPPRAATQDSRAETQDSPGTNAQLALLRKAGGGLLEVRDADLASDLVDHPERRHRVGQRAQGRAGLARRDPPGRLDGRHEEPIVADRGLGVVDRRLLARRGQRQVAREEERAVGDERG